MAGLGSPRPSPDAQLCPPGVGGRPLRVTLKMALQDLGQQCPLAPVGPVSVAVFCLRTVYGGPGVGAILPSDPRAPQSPEPPPYASTFGSPLKAEGMRVSGPVPLPCLAPVRRALDNTVG